MAMSCCGAVINTSGNTSPEVKQSHGAMDEHTMHGADVWLDVDEQL
jgi:hypothetical protein